LRPDALTIVDLCGAKDLNHLHAGTLLHITGTLADAMIATTEVGVSVAQATAIKATCITSGILTVTYGDSGNRDGVIEWQVKWEPLSAGGVLWAA
jgi:hypothetical protein